MSRKFNTFASALLSVGLLSAQAAEGDPAPFDHSTLLPWERGSVQVGGFISTFDSTLTFGRPGSGATFNAEDALGLDSSLTVIRAALTFRPDPDRRHQLDLSYAGYHRDGDATLTRDVTIGGNTYTAGARLETVFNFDIIRSTYSYALFQNDRARVALGLGAYIIPVEYGLDITTGGGRSREEGADTVIPFPTASLRVEYQIFPRVFLNLSVDGMYLEAGEFAGMMIDGTAGIEYRPWNHFGIGLAYSGMKVEVDTDTVQSDWPGVDFAGSVHVHYNGLLLYGKYSF